MFNVSFYGTTANVCPNKFIRNAKASEIAEAINIGTRQAEKALGVELKHPHGIKKMSGKLLTETNPDSFNSTTKTLTVKGQKDFNKIYGKQFNVTVDSKLKDLTKCAKKVAKKTADEDGYISYSFKYMA